MILTVGGLVAFTQFSDGDAGATSDDVALTGSGRCIAPREARANGARDNAGWYIDRQGARHHIDDGQVEISAETRRRCSGRWTRPSVNPSATTDPVVTTDPAEEPGENPGTDPTENPGGENPGGEPGENPTENPGENPGEEPGEEPEPTQPPATTAPPPLQILGNNCDESDLPPHSGFQDGDRCVSTSFGEVADANRNPSLLIAEAPAQVDVNEAFDIVVNTRNLQRDRFLAAGQGGYYLESAFLNEDGVTRGHIHTACRMLASTSEAPDPEPVPAFFVATEDNDGGIAPNSVTIRVPGLPSEGVAQCASWAGDGSHRIPMMRRANQIPAFDAVRVQVG